MTKTIKDTSLFAVYDPETGRENLYQYSALQLFDDVSFTIENELNDFLSVVIDPPSISFPGGNLAFANNIFRFTPASIPEFYDENQVKLINNYVDYLGDPVASNLGDTQEDVNLHYTPVVNTNELFRRALNVDPTTSFGITYDDADSPTRIHSIRGFSFVSDDHLVPYILTGNRNNTFSDTSTVNDLFLVRDRLTLDVNRIDDTIGAIEGYIRATENLNRGGDYLTYPDPDIYTDVTDTSSGLIPSRETIQEVSTEPDGTVVTTDITAPTTVLSWEDGVDKSFANVSRIRIHEFVVRSFNDNDSNQNIESKYNYSTYITGSYISLEYDDNTYLYEIVSHIPDTDPLRSAKHEIGSTGEHFYQFGVVSVQSSDDIVVAPITYNSVRLFTEETGINVGEADQRYVLATGDNMTGTLSFSEVAQPITISDDTSATLTLSEDGTATQPNLNDNPLDGNLVNRKNLTDAIDASESGSDGKFVKLVGDTMTGDLNIDNANFEVRDVNSVAFTTIDPVNKKVTVSGEVIASEVKSRIVDSGQSSNLELKWNGATKVYVGKDNISANAYVKLQKEGVDKDHAVTKEYVDARADSVQANLDTVHELDNVKIENSGGTGCTIEGASETQSGVVTTTGQVFTGTKTFKTDGKAIDIDGSVACQGDEGTPGYVLTSKGSGNKVEWTASNSEPGVPKGIVMFWPMEKAMIPFGWYALDGSTHSFDAAVDINFSSLHQVIKDKLVGYTYDDSAETGTLPDWSDRFAGQTGPNNGDDPGELKGSLTKRPVTDFKTNNQSSSHKHIFGIGHGHGNNIKAKVASGGNHKHTINSDLYANKDNSKSNTGNAVNYTRTNYNGGSAKTLTTKDMTDTEKHSHTVTMEGSVTDYTDPSPNTRTTESQDTSHKHTVTTGGDSVTRPQSVIGYWIIRS